MKRTRLKYFLRALGIGIIVATLLTGYSRRGQARMTDEEILQRAAALGMTERQGTLLSDIGNATPQPTVAPTAEPIATPTAEPIATPTAEPAATPTAEPAATPTAEPTATPTAEPEAGPTVAPTAEPTAEPAETPTDAPAGDTVTLVIRRGESSVTVSKSLQELGLIDDYKVYDKFLCDNGYDHYISAGIYEIPINSSHEEIVRIISKIR